MAGLYCWGCCDTSRPPAEDQTRVSARRVAKSTGLTLKSVDRRSETEEAKYRLKKGFLVERVPFGHTKRDDILLRGEIARATVDANRSVHKHKYGALHGTGGTEMYIEDTNASADSKRACMCMLYAWCMRGVCTQCSCNLSMDTGEHVFRSQL
ncbi:hypothetical protein PMAC_002755 [Pneumocystis sp. 'macacae']|nr:hypothetical protein PMAC_002755 [Pneumocystis sp. 'macacae']